jgi:hypothetical protein
MSILNEPSDGLFNVLIALAKCLAATGPIKKTKLLGLCAPISLTDQGKAKTTLRRWTQIGLFCEDDEQIRFADELPTRLSSNSISLGELASSIRHLIYAASNNERFWEKEKNQSADMCRLTAWMLAQDVHRFRPSNFQEADDLYIKQVDMEGVERQFTNSTRWGGFTSWGTFLGFGRYETGRGTGEFIIDPTIAVRTPVMTLLSTKNELPVRDFLQSLASLVPVIDGGQYRREVEGKLREKEWKSPDTSDVSTSLSRALLRLRSQRIIRLEKRSDAKAQVRLLGRVGRVVESVTHVQLGDSK